MKRQRLLNSEWKFIKDSLAGAENPNYDDSGWRTLDLPHTCSIEDLTDQISDSVVGPFSKASEGGSHMGYSAVGTGWYRKHFALEKEDQGKLFKIVFDGVMQESDVWLNGHHLGYQSQQNKFDT